ncbi:MAG TPA: hypothetical protein VN345_10425 [Blastocatellia bacterium]|nr:hypothetical protein [Blastocatellia bacterium]
MRRKWLGLLVLISLFGLALPATGLAQSRDNYGLGGLIKRGKNGIKVGDTSIGLLNGPGIVNYDYKHVWMPGPGGAATVIGAGAGGGALVGTLVAKKEKKKGALIGAAAGGGAATLVWLYKNRTERRPIF